MTDSSNSSSARSLQTRIVHPDDQLSPGFDSFSVPVARASTVVFPNLAAMRALVWSDDSQWRYGLHATPTSLALAQRLAVIEGGKHALLQPSGLSAISNVYFGLVKAGDHVMIPDNAYSPNREHADWLVADFGLEVTYYDPLVGAGIDALIRPNTKLIWLEAPGSVTMEVQDVPAITKVARARKILTAIDNTYSAGLAFKPFDHGVDISVQALTKYQSGASDILMGATITADKAIHMQLKRARMRMGVGVSSDDCSLVLRSLPSMQIRFDAHDRTALSLAHWLKTRPEIAVVLHPALADCPGHEFSNAISREPVDCSPWSSTNATARRKSIPSSRRWKTSRSAGVGAGRIVLPCRTTSSRCAPPGTGRMRACWCGFISGWKMRRICGRIWSGRCRA